MDRIEEMWPPLLIALGFAVTVAACSVSGPPPCPEGTDPFIQYELFMGRSDGSGEVVDDTVTPRFPDGLTVLDVRGQWRNAEGLVRKERSKLLVILVPPDRDSSGLIGEISEEYKHRFGQESVLQVVSDTCVSFS